MLALCPPSWLTLYVNVRYAKNYGASLAKLNWLKLVVEEELVVPRLLVKSEGHRSLEVGMKIIYVHQVMFRLRRGRAQVFWEHSSVGDD
jgi:hypothetical protein